MKMVLFDSNFNWIKDINLLYYNTTFLPTYVKAYDKGLLVYCSFNNVLFFDWNGKMLWNKFIYNISAIDLWFYYDEENDLLFHVSNNGLGLLIDSKDAAPVVKEDPETFLTGNKIKEFLTKKKINNIVVNGNTLLKDNKQVIIDGCIETDMDGNKYYVASNNSLRIYKNETMLGAFKFASNTPSIYRSNLPAISKTGDFYLLDYTDGNEVCVYRLKNFWDAGLATVWKKSKETNVAVDKIMSCNDNLRLRKEEATSSAIVTTMMKGTKVKIIKIGKAEKIDGISSNWVQVEIQAGGKDRDGKPIAQGTSGWCYGGYLE